MVDKTLKPLEKLFLTGRDEIEDLLVELKEALSVESTDERPKTWLTLFNRESEEVLIEVDWEVVFDIMDCIKSLIESPGLYGCQFEGRIVEDGVAGKIRTILLSVSGDICFEYE